MTTQTVGYWVAMARSISLLLACLILTASLAGCGGPAALPGPELTASLKGKLSYKGAPVKDARISFENASLGAYGALVNADGTYTVDKMAEGEFTVTVTVVEAQNPMVPTADGKMAPPVARTDIPESYRSVVDSKEKVTIKSGENTFDLDMKD
ncbi:MAG: carboxypeptidase regulatory-like domain-containing protein [Rhodopirellula sp.]|nr:carboxypeptidase regulatory-like domain-containing protein [Rhodopirellula sp.]